MRIRDLREDTNIKQVDMANYLHVQQSSYSKYETGQRNIPIEALIKLAYYYDTSVDYLLGITDEKKPYPRK
ncbi:MAG: helix-turn-helix transcriptional regulator [Clostridia bacterium]|nr:helix-turn-helix transcriptional regulator [Clostridia bacterium]